MRHWLLWLSIFVTFPCNAKPTSEPLPIEEVNRFTYFMEQIRSAYVEPIDDKALLEYAIQGMLNGLDPHSEYLDRTKLDDLREITEGNYAGVGIEVAMVEGKLTIISAIDDTPAAKAGIQSGDIVIAIDGTAFRGMRFQQALDMLRGENDTPLVLTIYRESSEQTFDLTLIRTQIEVVSVKYKKLASSLGYINIRQFQSGTTDDVLKALDTLNSQALTGLVLDLRNNPGGTLSSAIGVSDLFLDQGIIVSTKGKLADMNQQISATQQQYLANKPIVVLINSGSASASEIVAGALQDHKRAIIMGTQSFGKGSVQSVIEHGNVAIKLTTARYFTPSGHSIQGRGIKPDIEVTITQVSGEQAERLMGESSLFHTLKNTELVQNSDSTDALLASEDYQLYEAINLLLALNLYNKPSSDVSPQAVKQ